MTRNISIAAVRSVVVVDQGVDGWQDLTADLPAGVRLIALDGAQDGVHAIARATADLRILDAIHIIAHGHEGELRLGSARLSTDTIGDYADALEDIGRALKDGGDILLFGCDVARGTAGRQFIDDIALLTGANVAAASHPVGAIDLGASWELDVTTASIAVHNLLRPQAMAAFNGVLNGGTASLGASQGGADNPTSTGGNGSSALSQYEAGGGGGAGTTGGAGGNGSAGAAGGAGGQPGVTDLNNGLNGGADGASATPGAGGGGGGGGAHGFAGAVLPSTASAGGKGGTGGAGDGGDGGGGGAGGFGAVVTGTGDLGTLGVAVSGGAGGAGGSGFFGSGGGSGGTGLLFTNAAGTTFTVAATVTGGTGASGGTNGLGAPGTAGPNGVGIIGSNLNVTVTAAGTVTGVDTAIHFLSGFNTLQLQSGATINGNVVVEVIGTGTLQLGGTVAGSFDLGNLGAGQQYQGFADFEKVGAGTWTLTGAYAPTSPWTINAGTLLVDGSIANSSTIINNTATLGGSGTVGAVFIQSGGIVSPGASVGKLTANGTVNFGSGSAFKVEIGGDGNNPGIDYDQFAVAGSVFLNSTTLAASLVGSPVAGTVYKIIDKTSPGLVTGNFDGIGGGGTTYIGGRAFQVNYAGGDGNDVTLALGTLKISGTDPISVLADVNTTTISGLNSTSPTESVFRSHQLNGDINGTVNAGVTVDGFGLSITSTKTGGAVDFVNNGTIVIDAPAANSQAALALLGSGGGVHYSGAGSISNDATNTPNSDGLVVASSGGVGGNNLIQAAGSIAGAIGIIALDGTTAVVVSGTVTGTGGTAILFGAPSSGNTVDLKTTAVINGDLAGSGNDDGVRLSGTSGNGSFDLSKIGAGFSTLTKAEGSTWTVTGTLADANVATTIVNGALLVNGTIAGGVTVGTSSTQTSPVPAPMLGGTGSVGNVLVQDKGILSPGTSAGTLTVNGNLTMVGGSIFKEEIGGTTPGVTGYDQVVVNGTVSLGGATLNVSLINAFVLNGSSTASFTIIDNDGTDAVTGQFAGLAEGATLSVGTATYAITYQGGSNNNDVVLLAANDPPTFTGDGDISSYLENGFPVRIDVITNVSINDQDLSLTGDYSGTSLTIARHGGANADDVFGVSAPVDLTDGNNIRLSPGGTVIGTYSIGEGTISFAFNSSALVGDINFLMHTITYSNASDNPPASVQVDFTFSDGNGQPGGQDQGLGDAPGIAVGSFTVNITAVNDRPELFGVATNSSYTIGSAGTLLSPALTVIDVDSTAMVNAVVKIEDFALGDQLFVNLPTSGGFFIVDDGNGPVVTNISAQPSSLGKLVLSGNDTSAHYTQVLDAVSYRSTSLDPQDGGLDRNRTITWQVNDGTLASSPLSNSATSYPADLGPTGIASADVNGDGALDLVTSNGNDSISVLLGSTLNPGTFGAATNFTSDTSPRAVVIGDFDHSDTLDVVVASAGGATIMVGNGTGFFASPTTFAAGTGPSALAAGDFDDDGNLDVAVANSGSGNVSILRGNGGGGFFAPVNYATGTTPSGVAIGDFNRDGIDDLAVSNKGSNNVAILIGGANGTFGAATTFTAGAATNPVSVAIADLNGDGMLDLVTANEGTNNISVLLGNGAGGFGGPTTFSTGGTSPSNVQLADINADGKDDALVTNSGSDNVSVLIGNGNGTFQPTSPPRPSFGSPSGATVGDFNRDGGIDIATSDNGAGGYVTVWFNAGTNMSNIGTTLLAFNAPTSLDLDASSAGTGFTTTFTENTAPTRIVDTDVSITDPDDLALASATIVLTNAKPGDVLSISGALPTGVDGSIDTSVAGSITIRLNGSASLADYQTALGQVRFSTTALNLADRDITVVVSGGEVDSNVAHATVHVNPSQQTGDGGNNSFTPLPGAGNIDAGGGIDTVTFAFRLVDATVTYSGNKVIIDGPGSHTVLTGVEIFSFTDGTVNNNDSDVLVDDLFYYSKYHDVWNAHLDADADYHSVGWKAGRDPDAFFQTAVYLSANPDVKAAGVDPLLHFDASGWKEGRVPSITFDPAQYLAANPDVAAAHIDPLRHYLASGYQEGRQPFAPTELVTANGFDYVYYLNHNPDVAAAGVDPFVHFQTVGWKEGRNPNALFDTTGYLNTYTDVKAANVNPLDHYNQFGWKEGRDPSVGFDTTSYIAAYADVNAAHVNPLTHFLHYGIHEGRSAFGDGAWG